MNKKPNLYIIAGANGAGKTTTSFSVFPEILKCREYINADSIAKAISPFNPDSVALEAGKIMLSRIEKHILDKTDFAFETTLSSISLLKIIRKAKLNGFRIIVLFFYLNSFEIAYKRVKERVKQGGHSIPRDVIKRRYLRGLSNLINIYLHICDICSVVDNSGTIPEVIAKIKNNSVQSITIFSDSKWKKLTNHAKEKK